MFLLRIKCSKAFFYNAPCFSLVNGSCQTRRSYCHAGHNKALHWAAMVQGVWGKAFNSYKWFITLFWRAKLHIAPNLSTSWKSYHFTSLISPLFCEFLAQTAQPRHILGPQVSTELVYLLVGILYRGSQPLTSLHEHQTFWDTTTCGHSYII